MSCRRHLKTLCCQTDWSRAMPTLSLVWKRWGATLQMFFSIWSVCLSSKSQQSVSGPSFVSVFKLGHLPSWSDGQPRETSRPGASVEPVGKRRVEGRLERSVRITSSDSASQNSYALLWVYLDWSSMNKNKSIVIRAAFPLGGFHNFWLPGDLVTGCHEILSLFMQLSPHSHR